MSLFRLVVFAEDDVGTGVVYFGEPGAAGEVAVVETVMGSLVGVVVAFLEVSVFLS